MRNVGKPGAAVVFIDRNEGSEGSARAGVKLQHDAIFRRCVGNNMDVI